MARGRDHLLSPWEVWLMAREWNPVCLKDMPIAIPMPGTPLFTAPAFLSAVHAVPGDHRGSEETNL